MMDGNIELLERAPLFSGLSKSQLWAIAENSRKVFFEAGEAIIEAGAPGDTAYLILTGKAGCQKLENHQLVDEDLWPGTLIGELAILVETVHAFTVTAKERLRALAITRDAFRKVMEADPAVAEHISDKLVMRLQALTTDLRKLDERLAEIEQAA
jgi:CRP-like cAMP-binding protein